MSEFQAWDITQPFQGNNDFECYHRSSPRSSTPAFHSHDFYEFYFFISGDVSAYIEEYAYRLRPNDVVIFPPGRMHRAFFHNTEAYYERMNVYITREGLSGMCSEALSPLSIIEDCIRRAKLRLPLDSEHFRLCRYLISEVISDSVSALPYQGEINRLKIRMLMTYLCRWLSEAEGEQDSRAKNRIADVIAYIHEHIAEDLSLDALSARFFTSKYHLLREFKSYTNRTVHQYILSKRIVEAKLLMQSGTPPTDAYLKAGFRDYSSFYKLFRKETELSPQQYFKATKK